MSKLIAAKILPATLLLLWVVNTVTHVGLAQELTPEELEAWFEDDSRFSPYANDVNEGELAFLKSAPEKPVLHSQNRLTIKRTSIQDGWVSLYQCYANLDAVAVAEVVYQYKQIKNLVIAKKEKIEKAWVDGQSVQLENTRKGATLCVSADVHILYKTNDQTYTLKNGPFQRKFLDGYYPMHVTLNIVYPRDILKISSTKPKQQMGFDVQSKPGELVLDAWFEGRLFTEVLFSKPNND